MYACCPAIIPISESNCPLVALRVERFHRVSKLPERTARTRIERRAPLILSPLLHATHYWFTIPVRKRTRVQPTSCLATMAQLTDLPPEILHEIAYRLLSRYPVLAPWLVWLNRPSNLKSFCLVNRLCMNVGYSIMYGDFRVEVSSDAYARILLHSPRILMHVRYVPSGYLHIHSDNRRHIGTYAG